MSELLKILYLIFCVAIAKIGYCMHGSILWSIFDFFFPFFSVAKWLICEEINMQIIKNCFNFFLN